MNHRQLFLSHIAQTSAFPLALEFVSASGSFLYDRTGKKYLDLISGISVSNVGHRHPDVTAAIKNQVDQYMHQMVYGEFIQAPQVELAKALVDSLPRSHRGDSIDNVYFTNSGTEAVEGAMKLAKRYTGRSEIMAFRNAYHGATQGALSLGEEHYIRNFRPLLPAIGKLERNDFDGISRITERTAAVFIEPIGAEAGVRETHIAYMKAVAARCREVGALLIFDEIQTGLGRIGKMWAGELFGFEGDIVLSAKALGGGLPLGAFMAPKVIMESLMENPVLGHITTFGGNPVCCAAGLASLQVLQGAVSLNEVLLKGERIKQIMRQVPAVRDVRGKGLLLAVEFDNFTILKRHIDVYIQEGVITDWFLYCDDSMRIAPPLTITMEELDLFESIVLQVQP